MTIKILLASRKSNNMRHFFYLILSHDSSHDSKKISNPLKSMLDICDSLIMVNVEKPELDFNRTSNSLSALAGRVGRTMKRASLCKGII